MTTNKRKISLLSFLLGLIASEIFVVLLHFAWQASSTQEIFIYSPSRFFTIIILFFLFSSFTWLSIQAGFGTPVAQQFQNYVGQKNRQLFLRYFSYSAGALSWFLYFTPADRFGKLENYILTTKPLVALVLIISIQVLLYLALRNPKRKITSRVFQKHNRPYLISAITLFLCFVFLWIFFDISGLGIISNGEDWNEAGVPVLGWQVFFALLVGTLFKKIERFLNGRKLLSKKIDGIVFVLIWTIGGYLWANTPVPNGYLNPGPYPPTNEPYPFADAARFDLMSQYALIGQGINNSEAYNRPVYPAFLVYLHMLSGQNYDNNMGFQAALFAIFPALLYLLAKFLGDRGAGVAFSTLIILRGINGIAATDMINLANQKQMLTDFPTALIVGLILLGTVVWFRQPNMLYVVVLVGGLFGLGIYLRQTILGFFPIIVLLPFFSKLKTQKQFIALVLFILGIVTFGIPYEIKNYIEHPKYNYPAVIRKIITIAETRYQPDQETLAGREYSDLQIERPSWGTPNKFVEFKAFGNHFARNIITSTLILPHSLSIDSLRNTIKEENSFWRASWTGDLDIEQSIFLILNLAFVSIGVIFAIYRFPITGWIPLLFFFGYNLANAFARSSGGRYIVPVDWIVLFYYLVGLFQSLIWTVSAKYGNEIIPEKREGEIRETKTIPFAFLFVFALGTFLILPDFIFQQKFEADGIHNAPSLVGINYDEDKHDYIEKLLSSENIVIKTGQIMYPRYYLAGDGEFSFYYPFKELDYSRLAFIFIGPHGTNNAIMPGTIPEGLANLSEAIIVGCPKKDEDENYIDIGMIFITSGNGKTYFREPLLEANCAKPSTKTIR